MNWEATKDSFQICSIGVVGVSITLSQVQALVGIAAGLTTILCTLMVTRKKLRDRENATERYFRKGWRERERKRRDGEGDGK